jgi:GPH family glycoside/pentoside/hexuronide:cation symporter
LTYEDVVFWYSWTVFDKEEFYMAETSAAAQPEKKRITKAMRTFWGLEEVGEGFTMGGGIYQTFFITDIARLSLPLFSFYTMITSILDFIISPLTGILIDATKPMKWGKLRSWLLIMPPIAVVAAIFKYVAFPNQTVTMWVLIVAFAVYSIAFNTGNIANYSLIPAMCAYEDEKQALASNRIAGNAIGRMIMGFVTPLAIIPLTGMFGNAGYTINSFAITFSLMIFYLVHFKLSKGYEGNGTSASTKRATFKEMAKAVAANPQLVAVMFADMTSTIGTFMLPGLLVYMYRYVIADGQMMGLLATHNLVVSFGSLIGAYVSRFLMRKFEDRRKLCCAIYVTVAILCFSTRFTVDVPYLFIFVNFLMMMIAGATQPMESTFYFDCAIYSQWKTGGENPTALFLGLATISIKMISIVRGVVITILFNAINYNPDMGATPELRSGFITAYSLVNSIIPMLGFIAIFFFYKISPAIVQKCKDEIAARGPQVEA